MFSSRHSVIQLNFFIHIHFAFGFFCARVFFLHGFFGGKRFVNICEWRREWTTVLNRKRINRKVPSFAFFFIARNKVTGSTSEKRERLVVQIRRGWMCCSCWCPWPRNVWEFLDFFLCASTVDRFVLTTTNRRSQGILLNVHTLGAVESPLRTCLFGYFFAWFFHLIRLRVKCLYTMMDFFQFGEGW